MESRVKDNLDTISATTTHIRDLIETSKIERATKLFVSEIGRDRILPLDGSEKAIFPVEHLPQFRAEVFIGRQDDMRKIHDWLGDPEP